MAFTDDKQSLKSAKHDFGTAYSRQVFEANDCRSGRAAKALDIHYSALIKKIKTKGITINKSMGVSNGLLKTKTRGYAGMPTWLLQQPLWGA